MKKEDAMKLSEEALSELAKALAAGKSEQLVAYLETMGRFHRYSFGNCMLIANQHPTATRVAGFGAWKKLGRTVKKSEKGICILAPMMRKADSDKTEEAQSLFGFRAVHVFDIVQTSGDELPEFARVSGDPGEKLQKLRQVVQDFGIELEYVDDLGGPEGISKGGTILLLSGLTPAADFVTLAHEYAHERMHRNIDRSKIPKVVRELEAEAVAFVIAQSVNLNNTLAQSSDYIQLYSGDQKQLLHSLERVQKTASVILTELENLKVDSPNARLH